MDVVLHGVVLHAIHTDFHLNRTSAFEVDATLSAEGLESNGVASFDFSRVVFLSVSIHIFKILKSVRITV